MRTAQPGAEKSKPMKKREQQRDLFPGALEMMIMRTIQRQPMHLRAGPVYSPHIGRPAPDRRGLALSGLAAPAQGWYAQIRMDGFRNQP
jgi:hypothetical protein